MCSVLWVQVWQGMAIAVTSVEDMSQSGRQGSELGWNSSCRSVCKQQENENTETCFLNCRVLYCWGMWMLKLSKTEFALISVLMRQDDSSANSCSQALCLSGRILKTPSVYSLLNICG